MPEIDARNCRPRLTVAGPRNSVCPRNQGMERRMARIRHIAIFSDDPANLAEFYADVFNMKINGKSNQGAVWMTDGYMDIALLPRRGNELAPQGVHHFGITIDVDEKDHVYNRLKERGHKLMTPPP